jgi:hypothetical protein
MAFQIADVPLIPQTQTWACWYASAQMLITWRRNRTLQTERAHPDPSEVPLLQGIFAANHGLSLNQIVVLARQLGLTPVPPMTPSPSALSSWLADCGPLWFAGLFPAGHARSGHAVVITGTDDTSVSINDPWPPTVGAKYKLPYVNFGDDLRPMPTSDGLAPNLLYFRD